MKVVQDSEARIHRLIYEPKIDVSFLPHFVRGDNTLLRQMEDGFVANVLQLRLKPVHTRK